MAVYKIGGSHLAAELDAKRAIDQARRHAYRHATVGLTGVPTVTLAVTPLMRAIDQARR